MFSQVQNAYGEELTLTGASPVYPVEERALDVKSNVFCSAGQVLGDGTILSIGGSSDASNADPLLNGSFAIRAFNPCIDKKCDFQLLGDMTSKRWYPTAQVMPDGRVLIVGGANVYGNIAINTMGKNNPTVEYWPRKPGEGVWVCQPCTPVLCYCTSSLTRRECLGCATMLLRLKKKDLKGCKHREAQRRWVAL